MSRSHQHFGGPGSTQNQGNSIGDRPCVRQSKIGREHEGGNQMKALLGHDDLAWDTKKTQGAYAGGRVHDARTERYTDAPQQQQPMTTNPREATPPQTVAPQSIPRRGTANQQSIDIFGGNAPSQPVGSRSHMNAGGVGSTQNQGNIIGDRPCVRQSKIGREHEGGNQMKALLGHDDLAWNVNKVEGAYSGARVYDAQTHAYKDTEKTPAEDQPRSNARGRGNANKQSVNIFGN